MKDLPRRVLLVTLLSLAVGTVGYIIGRSHSPRASETPHDRPLIGIASVTSENYINAVRQAGGIPVVLPNTNGDTSRIDDYLEVLDGLLLPGGVDIPPSEYGEQAHRKRGQQTNIDSNPHGLHGSACLAQPGSDTKTPSTTSWPGEIVARQLCITTLIGKFS